MKYLSDPPSASEMVLVAATDAAEWTTRLLPYSDIVVSAWKRFPEQYCLPGYPEYPDSSNVHKQLYGSLKSAGYILAEGKKTFRLTEAGLAKARELTPRRRAVA